MTTKTTAPAKADEPKADKPTVDVAKAKTTLIDWERPSGSKITTNKLPATVAYATKLGWKKIGER